jgi:hypothetical protein
LHGLLALVVTAVVAAIIIWRLSAGGPEATDNPNPPPGRAEQPGAPP